MLQEALEYPKSGDEAVKRIVVGGVLSLLSILVIPAFIVSGYLIRVIRNVSSGEEQPPTFNDWSELFVDGIKVTVIGLAYMGMPIILYILMIFMFGFGGQSSMPASMELVLVLMFLVPLLFLISGYLLPAAIVRFANEERMSAAFEFGTLKDLLFSVEYLVAWVLVFALSIIVGIVSNILAITVIGLVLVPPLSFYMQVSTVYLFGQSYVKTFDLDDAPGSSESSVETAA